MQLQADILNKDAATWHKRGLLKYEPVKIVIAAFAAGGVFLGALGGGAGYLIGRHPSSPPQIIILPAPKP